MKFNRRDIQIRYILPLVVTVVMRTPPPPTNNVESEYFTCFVMGLLGGVLIGTIIYDYAETWDNCQEPETDTESDEEAL